MSPVVLIANGGKNDNTEYGFRMGAMPGPDALSADDSALPLMFGQPFTPGLSGDDPWGTYFHRMPHLGFRVASDVVQ